MKRIICLLLVFLLGACTAGTTDATSQRDQRESLATLYETGHCPGCDLRDRNLREFNFSKSNLSGANLSNTNLQSVNLVGANLSGAKLTKANLRYANLENADLRGADLREAKLLGAQLKGALTERAKVEGTVAQIAETPETDSIDASIKQIGTFFGLIILVSFLPLLLAIALRLYIVLVNFCFKRGLARAIKGDYKGAITQYTIALRLNPQFAQPVISRGEARLQVGAFKEAIADADRALTLLQTRAMQEIVIGLHRAVTLDANLPIAYWVRGVALANLGQPQAAILEFNQALSLNPQLGIVYAERGAVRSALGDDQGALHDLNQAIQVQPNAASYAYRSQTHYGLGNFTHALEDATESLRLQPSATAYYGRGLARYELGDAAGAFADWQQAIAVKPSSLNSPALKAGYYVRGLACSRQGDQRAAVEDFYKALRLDAKFADAYADRGLARYYLGNIQGALEDLTKALALKPAASYYYYQGIITAGLGQYREAIAAFRGLQTNKVPVILARYRVGNPPTMLNDTVKATLKDAAQKLTGHRKRDFMAKVAEDYFEGSARKTETVLGWNRDSVQLGLHERRSGLICTDHYRARGRHKSETILTNLETDIRHLVDVQAQADPKFQSTFLYARISAAAVRETLIGEKGYDESQLPSRQTIGAILNRLGYRLKKHKKSNP